MSVKSEFKVADAYPYNHASPVRWILSHIWRYKFFLFSGFGLYILSIAGFSSAPLFVGRAVDAILNPTPDNDLWKWALAVF